MKKNKKKKKKKQIERNKNPLKDGKTVISSWPKLLRPCVSLKWQSEREAHFRSTLAFFCFGNNNQQQQQQHFSVFYDFFPVLYRYRCEFRCDDDDDGDVSMCTCKYSPNKLRSILWNVFRCICVRCVYIYIRMQYMYVTEYTRILVNEYRIFPK